MQREIVIHIVEIFHRNAGEYEYVLILQSLEEELDRYTFANVWYRQTLI